ncbi:MAG: hypothetical protein ABFS56_11270 [Pseudomonadota bacterium]
MVELVRHNYEENWSNRDRYENETRLYTPVNLPGEVRFSTLVPDWLANTVHIDATIEIAEQLLLYVWALLGNFT